MIVVDNFEMIHSTYATNPAVSNSNPAAFQAFLSKLSGSPGECLIVLVSRNPEGWLEDVHRIELRGLTVQESSELTDRLLPGSLIERTSLWERRQARAFGRLLERSNGHPAVLRWLLPHLDTLDASAILIGLSSGDLVASEHDLGRLGRLCRESASPNPG